LLTDLAEKDFEKAAKIELSVNTSDFHYAKGG